MGRQSRIWPRLTQRIFAKIYNELLICKYQMHMNTGTVILEKIYFKYFLDAFLFWNIFSFIITGLSLWSWYCRNFDHGPLPSNSMSHLQRALSDPSRAITLCYHTPKFITSRWHCINYILKVSRFRIDVPLMFSKHDKMLKHYVIIRKYKCANLYCKTINLTP